MVLGGGWVDVQTPLEVYLELAGEWCWGEGSFTHL